jgi:acetyltransferase-like isoleucine patch superfamily enzyme
VRRFYAAAATTVGRVRLRVWALKTDLRMRGNGGRFKLELAAGRVRFRTLPYVRIRAGEGGGTTTVAVGTDVQLGSIDLDVSPAADAQLTIGAHCEFERGVRIQLFGRRLLIGEACEFRDNVTLKTSRPGSELLIGNQVRLGRGVEVHCNERVQIDDRVTIAERASILDLYHDVDGSDAWSMEQPVRTEPVHIETNVMLFCGAIVLHGAHLGRNSIVAANAVLPGGSHPAGQLYVGAPAKAARPIAGMAWDKTTGTGVPTTGQGSLGT